MEKTYPLGVLRDRTKEAQPRTPPEPGPALEEIPRILGVIDEGDARRDRCAARRRRSAGARRRLWRTRRPAARRSAGRSGAAMRDLKYRGCRRTGRKCARAPRIAMCGWRASPSIRRWWRRPDVLVAMNEPSLRKFWPACAPAAGLSTTAKRFPEECKRRRRACARPPLHARRRRTGRWPRGATW